MKNYLENDGSKHYKTYSEIIDDLQRVIQLCDNQNEGKSPEKVAKVAAIKAKFARSLNFPFTEPDTCPIHVGAHTSGECKIIERIVKSKDSSGLERLRNGWASASSSSSTAPLQRREKHSNDFESKSGGKRPRASKASNDDNTRLMDHANIAEVMGTLKKVTEQVADAVAKVRKSTLKSYSKYSPLLTTGICHQEVRRYWRIDG